jgi:hypothetical protein
VMQPRDREIAQEIGIDPMAGLSAAERRLPIQGLTTMRRIRGGICRLPMARPSCRKRSRSIRAPANGYCRCSSSIRRISASTVSDTGVGWE